MKWVLLCLMAIVAITTAEKYTDRYDYMNVHEIINNKKLLHPYLKCILGQGKCTPEGKEITIHLEEALRTGCEKCTDKQKEGARIILKHVMEKEQQYWEQLKAKFDPNDEYKHIYLAFLAEKN